MALRSQVLADVQALENGAAYVWFESGADATMPFDGVFAGWIDFDVLALLEDPLSYLCGPLPFMQAARSALIDRGAAPRDIQYELFGPDLWAADLLTETSPGADGRSAPAAAASVR